MNLHDLVERYIALHQALGKSFVGNASRLRGFVRVMGPGASISDVTPERVTAFLTGEGPLTRTYHAKHSVLRGFFRYARSRGHLGVIPLPALVPKPPPPFQPYIYSHEELRRLIGAVDSVRRRRDCTLSPATVRAVLLLLYGAGLRISEAIALDRQDVDLEASLLRVHASKFFKSRLLPLGATLTRALADYAARPVKQPTGGQCPFFATRGGGRVTQETVRMYFRLVCEQAGIRRQDNVRHRPRLHDLRHTFAVHRLTAWYRQGADVQALLPHLSVYLGHRDLAATQRYLSMTPELLQQASGRFERYAFEGGHRG
jgi:site-specific recombinase XerD